MMKKVIVGFNQHGRRLLERVPGLGRRHPLSQIPRAEPVAITQASKASASVIQRLTGKTSGVVSRYIANNVTPIWAQELRSAARFRTHAGSFSIYGNYRAMGSRVSMFAFVAFGMASNTRVTEPEIPEHFDQVKNDVKSRISEMLEKKNRLLPDNPDDIERLSIDQFSFGPMIAKGCCGAVYEAKYKAPESDIVILSETEDDEVEDEEDEMDMSDSDIEVISLEEVESLAPQDFEVESDIEIIDESDFETSLVYNTEALHAEKVESFTETIPLFDLAIKMMFNFDTESLAYAIWDRMQNELVPSKGVEAHGQMEVWHSGIKAKMKSLPPHPNIVAMQGAFVSEIPQLKSAFDEYPDALPERLNPDGYGRNKTLFIVMKKYQLTLRQYLQSRILTPLESVLLFVQLLEAIIHLEKHGFAHRDLKSDNLLVDFDGDGSPTLALTDFGCCLPAGRFGLKVHYSSRDICKGGNGALMAPEIACAQPGLFSWLDYSKSDLWAAGAIAYEIFGAENPFYRDGEGQRLDTRQYEDEALPALPENVPFEVQSVVHSLLSRDPSKRPSATSASNALHAWLWLPLEWKLQRPRLFLTSRWLLSTAASVMLRSTFLPNLENTLQALFLSHVEFKF